MNRRNFIIAGTGVGYSLAGCAGLEDTGQAAAPPEADDPTPENTGTFRLLISDQPNAIGDFDELNVGFSHARIFRGDTDSGEEASPSGNSTAENTSENATQPEVGANSTNITPEGSGTNASNTSESISANVSDSGPPDDTPRGWIEIELDERTVDLTTVIGEDAVPVSEMSLEEGTYSSIELYVESVEGIAADDESAVAGDGADDNTDTKQLSVHVPSDKLRLVRPFEVVSGEEVSFVFDINVVKRGRSGEYNLLPVIGQSGVVGEDVEATEIDPADAGGGPNNAGAPDDAGGGPPDDRGQPDDRGADGNRGSNRSDEE